MLLTVQYPSAANLPKVSKISGIRVTNGKSLRSVRKFLEMVVRFASRVEPYKGTKSVTANDANTSTELDLERIKYSQS